MEFLFLAICLSLIICIFVLSSLYKTNERNKNTISNLNTEKYSLEKKWESAESKLSDCINLLKTTNSTLEKAISDADKQKLQINSLASENSSLESKCFSLASENTSLENKYDVLKSLNSSANKRIQELKKLKILAEKTLSEAQLSHLKMNQSIQDEFDSNLSDMPQKFTYIASLMADYLTLKIKQAEVDLNMSDKYHERQRAKKINEIRAETKEILTTYKEAQYQLDYLIQLYPELNDVVNSDALTNLNFQDINSKLDIFNDDPVSRYISRSEWEKLIPTERNQLALERYLQRPKSNWEIGRDYELYIAYIYELKGYCVDTFGSYMRINDLGRDLIAKKGDKTEIIQCKYWSTRKEIHENHICQLFGTVICYCIENNLSTKDVEPVFITSTTLSKKAKEFADMLKIKTIESIPLKDFPRIKCNIGYSDYEHTHIYHLPIDPLYDKVKISKKGECYCNTVYEAESLGFRRAYKWHGN